MTSVAFASNFWGKDPHRGPEVVYKRMNIGVDTMNQLADFYREKIAIEREYSQRLQRLGSKKLGPNEGARVRKALDSLAGEYANMGEAHGVEAQEIETQVVAPLEQFIAELKKDIMSSEKVTQKVLEQRDREFAAAEAAKSEYFTQCESLFALYQKRPHDIENIRRQERQLGMSRGRHESATMRYGAANKAWSEHWRASCGDIEDQEAQRINYIKTNAWNVVNVTATTCVNVDKCCENVRVALEKCDTAKDIAEFVKAHKTGDKEINEMVFSSREAELERSYNASFAEGTINGAINGTIDGGIDIGNSPKQVTFTSSTRDPVTQSYDSESDNEATFQRQFDSLSLGKASKQEQLPHLSDTDSSNSSDNHSLGQNTYASSHTSGFSSPTQRDTKSWNSPTRRRSRLSPQKAAITSKSTPDLKLRLEKQAQVERYYERNEAPPALNVNSTAAPNDSILNTSTMRNFDAEETGVSDPLRAALEDLRIGGNGDFNALKERHNTIKSQKSQKSHKPLNKPLNPAFNVSVKARETVAKPRPKSMIEIAEMSQSMKSAKSGVALAPNGLPLVASNGKPVVRHAKAVYSYEASIPEEVSFKRKDLMLVLGMQDDGWWEVEVLGKKRSFGLAPSNYLVPA